MYGSGAEAGVKGCQEVVEAVKNRFGGDADGGLVGGMDGGGGGYIRYIERDGLSRWEDNVSHVTLGTDHNAPLVYALVLELHHPSMSNFGEQGDQLER